MQTFTFQNLLFFALFSLVSIRERRFFWSSRPSTALSVALIADACAGILIGTLLLRGQWLRNVNQRYFRLERTRKVDINIDSMCSNGAALDGNQDSLEDQGVTHFSN